MNNSFSKINVLIITYKQEDVIGRALDSVLCQKDYGLNKIIVCDDCSPDNNWGVIQEYAQKYPDIIEGYRNEKNLGIYGNAEKVVSLKGDADYYYLASGDDALCDGWFCEIQKFINNNKIESENNAVCIFSDWMLITPDGSERIYKQNALVKHNVNPSSLRIRGIISGRSMLQSKKVLDQIEPVDLEHGVSKAEKFFDYQPILHGDHFYYCPFVGSVYYSGIGVSAKASTIEFRKGVIEANKSFLQRYRLNKSDERYVNYRIKDEEFKISPSFKKYIKRLSFYFSSLNLRYGFSLKELLRVVVGR